jgi:hypothetical protein
MTVAGVVKDCTKYDYKLGPTIGEMESIAWLLVTKGAGKRVGFLSPQERQHKFNDTGFLD